MITQIWDNPLVRARVRDAAVSGPMLTSLVVYFTIYHSENSHAISQDAGRKRRLSSGGEMALAS